ncbi:MAG: hypothetical protein WC635_11725 [Bacteriovorax sp.]|jgi:hypothetical protein
MQNINPSRPDTATNRPEKIDPSKIDKKIPKSYPDKTPPEKH